MNARERAEAMANYLADRLCVGVGDIIVDRIEAAILAAEAEAYERVAKEYAKALDVLRLIEWTKRSRGPARCPCCNGVTHTIGCSLADALRSLAKKGGEG